MNEHVEQLQRVWAEIERRGDEDMSLGDPPRQGALSAEARALTSPQEVRDAIKAFGGKGWVMCTDAVRDLSGAPDEALPDGVVLASEQVSGETSLHIRQSDDGWTAWVITRSSEGPQLIFEESFMRRPRGKLTYEVAYALEDGVYRPALSRLSRVDP